MDAAVRNVRLLHAHQRFHDGGGTCLGDCLRRFGQVSLGRLLRIPQYISVHALYEPGQKSLQRVSYVCKHGSFGSHGSELHCVWHDLVRHGFVEHAQISADAFVSALPNSAVDDVPSCKVGGVVHEGGGRLVVEALQAVPFLGVRFRR